MKLLTSQKDTLFDIIESNGLTPSQFEFTETISRLGAKQKATNLKYKDSDYFFSFESDPKRNDTHFAIFCPGTSTFIERNGTGLWEYQLNRFRTWLSNLSREIHTPNKWERLEIELSSISFRIDNDSDKFSVTEYEDLKNRMLNLKQQTGTIGLLPDQVDAINSKLDHLTELAKDLNKFDWKGLFVGTIISMVIQLGVTPENTESLWSIIKIVFNNYLLP